MSGSSSPQFELPAWRRSSADEMVNAATHAVGLVLAIVGALIMAGSVVGNGDPLLRFGCGVYLASLVMVYAMSTLSHTARAPRWKRLFRRLDQGFIYLLIVGTFTPFALAYMRSGSGWLLLGGMWGLAVFGFVAKVFFAHRVEAVSIVSYIVLGWMPILAAPAMIQTMPLGAFLSALGGGVCYSLGTLFLINDQRVPHFHAVWHLWVIAGSVCHFVGILIFVI